MGRKFKCMDCGGEFESAWTEKEAREEQAENGWGDMDNEDMGVVCDDCYEKIMASIN